MEEPSRGALGLSDKMACRAHLPALNVTVDVARAGKPDKGFTLVVSEAFKLAERSL